MKSTTASLIITALASTVIAQPHGHQHPARAAHQHGHQDHKRALVTEWEIEWVTETVTEYIDASTTQIFYPTQSASTPATTLATVKTYPTPGDFLEKTSSSSSSTPVVIAPVETPSSSSSIYVAPPAPTTTSSSSIIISSSSTSEVYVAPETTTSTTPVEIPTTTPVVETPIAAPTTAAAAPAATTAAVASSSSESGSTVSVNTDISAILGSDYQTGDLTYYDLGLGACGVDNTGQDQSANIVAMSSATMGSQSNGNPMCGKSIKIYNKATGKTATGIIQDKCPGCVAGSIDVSRKLFEDLADLDQGRLQISWNWA
ncbi:hypothetical protein VMCG_09061 [Cytospora schulzeri]|uniref:RlpA-like protein double-psi beta-barrel domain-containing protein n=1 Tax=Cytospora schulzeri TaxID=448051 RepID=A0A423VP53_9PEZI|nr:hypothetical protein VMCG_09061 [Valsa malicola]